MRRFPANVSVQESACLVFYHLMSEPNVVQRFCDAGGGGLVCSALLAHISNADVARVCCKALFVMLVRGHEQGIAPTIDVEAITALKADALRAHPSNAAVEASVQRLTMGLLYDCSASTELAALDRVAELKGRRDFASLVRDMDAFPECEELQRDGCDAITDILSDGGSCEKAAAASAIECVTRTLDLFPYSADTQLTSMRALASLTVLEVTAHRVCSAGAVRLAVHALRSFPNDMLLICEALSLLGNIAAKDQFRVEALNLGVLALGVAALRRYLSVVWSRHSLTLRQCV